MNDQSFLWFTGLFGLMVVVIVSWLSGSWSPERRRQFHALWPVVYMTTLFGVISFSYGGLLALSFYWPPISLILLLAVGYMSRKWKTKTKIYVRAVAFGLFFAPMPTPYGILLPAVVTPFVWWGQADEIKNMLSSLVSVIGLIELFAAIAATYLFFIGPKNASISD